MTSAEAYKRNEQQAWDSFSRRYTTVALPEFRPYGRRLIELGELRRGMWVLDIATGPGEPALSVARRVGPNGLVVGVDFAAAMVRTASARARKAQLRNLEFLRMDAEDLELPDSLFDRAFCRFALMLMPHAERALSEMYRVLAPGGRVVVAVWSLKQHVNTMGIIREALSRYDAFHPPPGAPDFFRFGKRGALKRALRDVGFRKVRTEHMTVEWMFASPEDFWKSMKQSPSLRRGLAKVPPAARRAIKEEVFRRLLRFARDGALRVPNEAVLAVGDK